MTNKEFFVEVLNDERPRFRKALEALPEEKHGHKVHDKSREAGNIAHQLAVQWEAMSNIIVKGAPIMDSFKGKPSKSEMLAQFDKSFDQLFADLGTITEDDWLNSEASMGEVWKAKKYWMVWGFLFDAIHHRGQLSTFLRNMGEKVPSIYGPSADDSNG